MELVTAAADLAAMSDKEEDDSRGARIERRLAALGIKDREWYRETGIDRKTLNRAIANLPTVRESTYTAIETNLDRLERRGQAPVTAQGELVTFRLSGNFGVEVTVQGPVHDMDAMEAAVERLIRKMGEEPSRDSNPDKS